MIMEHVCLDYDECKNLDYKGWLKMIKDIEDDFFDMDHWKGDDAFITLHDYFMRDANDSLSDEQKREIEELIERKIAETPDIIKRRDEMWAKIEQEHAAAWDAARTRYKSQSIFKKVGDWYHRRRPQDINPNLLSAKSLDNLYGGAKDDR